MNNKIFNECVFIARNIMLRKKEGVLPRFRWKLSSLKNHLELKYDISIEEWNKILETAKGV